MNEVVVKIQNARRFEELSMLCYAYFEKRGVCQFSYFHFPPIGAVDFDRTKIIVWLGYPEAWVEAYQNAGYVENDPVVARLLRENHPVWTQDILNAPDASQDEMKYLKLLIHCGVHNDLAVPVFGPGGRNGGYGIGFQDDATQLTALEINEIQWICQTAHIQYCELLDRKFEKAPQLSGRETEVLRLIAQGRTNTQVASKLEVTSKTIETYLSRIFAKLDVNDRMTAALRAISSGAI